MPAPPTPPPDRATTGAFAPTDLSAKAKSLLLEQFKGSPQLAALLGNYVSELQDLEAVFRAIYSRKSIDGAAGVQLDIIGTLVGEPRSGRSDSAYRIALRARIAINLAEGTGDQILDIMYAVTGQHGTLSEGMASILYRLGAAISSSLVANYAAALQSATAAGVYTQMQYAIAPMGTSFTLDGTSLQALDAGTFEDVY